MKQSIKTSVALTEDEVGILDATANRLGMSRSEVMRHLIIFQGLAGGDFPLTRKILNQPEADRIKAVAKIRRSAEKGEFIKPAVFKAYMADAFGSAEPAVTEAGLDAVVKKLLED